MPQAFPLKSHRCAVVIPTHKVSFSVVESFCISTTLRNTKNWDVFFLIPDSITSLPEWMEGFGVVRFSSNHFVSNDTYNRWLLHREVYDYFSYYDKLLLAQTDAIIIKDEIDFWSRKHYDIIGAPWFSSIRFTPTFRCRPDLNGKEFRLKAGNGGLCMLNPRAIPKALEVHKGIVGEFLLNVGNQVHQDVFFAFLAMIDDTLVCADIRDSASFSLEILAREWVAMGNPLPMGFHALFKNDPEYWAVLFPECPRT